MVRNNILLRAFASLVAVSASPAFAQAAAANAVKDKLAGLLAGAVVLGVVTAGWKNWLDAPPSREQVALFVIGALIVAGGGYWLV